MNKSREESDREIIALSNEAAERVVDTAGYFRARVAANRLRRKLIEDAEKIAARLIMEKPEEEAVITERLRSYKALMSS